jgi:hypothetical protein
MPAALFSRILHNRSHEMEPAGFVDDDPKKRS